MDVNTGSRSGLDEARLERLLEIGRELAGVLDLDRVLDRALSAARELTGARYAALGVLDARREELERFITRGVDAGTIEKIGPEPRGHGVLGLLIRDPKPLRLDDVVEHPASVGMPPGHPPMHSFLGVPLVIDGEAWGNLYLTEKAEGRFTATDEHTAEILAGWIATAIGNAQLYQGIAKQRDELQRANRALEAATEIARAVGGQTELKPILETIVQRGRLLVDAESLSILLTDEDQPRLVLAASSASLPALSLSASGSTAGYVQRHRRPLRVEHLDQERLEMSPRESDPGAMMVPLLHRGNCLGVLVAIDSRHGRSLLPGRDEEPVLLSVAASAATAVGTARGVAESRVRDNLEAAERERARWARELHDDTLQNLAGLRMLLSGARRRQSAGEDIDGLLENSLDQVDATIAELRRLIADLRPAALDELGIGPALSALAERIGTASGLKVELDLDLGEAGPPARLPATIETTAYRLVQEALNNVVAHAEATEVTIQLAVDSESVGVRVADDGRGFDPGGFWRRSLRGLGGDRPERGFGLPGMRERVALLRGWLDVDSSPGRGCTLTAIIPRDQGR